MVSAYKALTSVSEADSITQSEHGTTAVKKPAQEGARGMTNLKEHREPNFSLPEILKTAGHVAGAGMAATVGGVVAVTTSGCCGGGSSSSSSSDSFNYEAWAETDGAAGRINMQAVQQAFEQATDPSDFEIRINRIYEGEHPVLIRVYNQGQQQMVEGWEDLDDSGTIVQTSDDKLFTLTRGQQGATLQGHGSNSYYTHTYPPTYNPMGGFWTGFLVANMMRPGWGGYYTPMARRSVIVSNVRAYRSSPAYAATRNANRSFFANQRATNPRFAAASRNYSPARQSFRGSVRSSGGSFRRGGGFGRSSSFRGGGR